MKSKCDFNCDDCRRTLCTQGSPALEPTPEELEEQLEESERLIARMNSAFHFMVNAESD